MEYPDDLKFKVITYLREHGKDNPDIGEIIDQFSELFDKMRRGEKLSPIYAVAVYNILEIIQEQTTIENTTDIGEVDCHESHKTDRINF